VHEPPKQLRASNVAAEFSQLSTIEVSWGVWALALSTLKSGRSDVND
jgi:hypothetical protein